MENYSNNPIETPISNELVTDYPQFLYVKTLEEQLHRCVRDSGESADDYWAKGWSLTISDGHRSNFEEYQGLYRKTFPTRYLLHGIALDKDQTSVLRRNTDLDVVVRPLRITPAKERLHLEHNLYRFQEAPKLTLSGKYKYIKYHPAAMKELCVFDAEELIAFSIFEQADFSILSHAGIWSPQHARRSLGIFTLLREMQFAAALGHQYYYCGPFNKHNPKYAYKTRIPGLQLYDWDRDRWIDYTDPYVPELLDQNLPRWR